MRADLRNGVALLEALAAMSILGVVGVSLAQYVSESAYVSTRASMREEEIMRASSVLARLAVMRRVELQAHVGNSRLAGVIVHVQSSGGDLFRVVVTSEDRRELLVTWLAPRQEGLVSAP